MPIYPGSGQAKLINCNKQKFFFSNERIAAGLSSVAYELHRVKGQDYPWGCAIEVAFSADPGTFEVDIQGAETDMDSRYCTLQSTGVAAVMASVNATFVCRYCVAGLYYPKFIRLHMQALGNDVLVTALLTR